MSDLFRAFRCKKWTPVGFFRFVQREHICLPRELVCLPGIALDARADHVLPRGWASLISWNNMVQVQIPRFESVATVLAGKLVPLENRLSAELDFLPRDTVIRAEDDDGRDSKLIRNRPNHIRAGVSLGLDQPGFGIMREEIRLFVCVNDLRMSQKEKTYGSFDATDMNRLPKPIEHQHLTVDGCHRVGDSTHEKECINPLFLLQKLGF